MITTTRRIPRPRPAVQPERHLHSPLGDQRERAVTCQCGGETFNVCARCDRHCTCADRSPLQQAIADEIRRLGCR